MSMDTLDLFKGWTPEMIENIKHAGKGSHWKFLTPERREEIGKNISKGLENMSPEAKEARNKKISEALLVEPQNEERRRKNSESHTGKFLSEETKREIGRKCSKTTTKWRSNMSPEEKIEMNRKNSESNIKVWASRTPEEREELNRKNREAQGKHWASLSEKEKEEFLKTSFHSDKARKTCTESKRRYWASLTPEEVSERMRNSLLSDEAMRKASISNHTKPSMPEWFVGIWLEREHPGEWAYTGDRKSMDLLRSQGYTGTKCPDFTNIDGRKAFIEVLGGIGYFHTEEDEEIKVEYYRKHRVLCLVLFEEDCYDYGKLEKRYNIKFSEKV